MEYHDKKTLDEFDFTIISSQGELFDWYASSEVDFEQFIVAFMHSDFCNRHLDAECDYEQLRGYLPWIETVNDEVNINSLFIPNRTPKMMDSFSNDIGSLYRMFQRATLYSSSSIIDKVPIAEVIKIAIDLETAGNFNDAIETMMQIYKSN